MTAPDRLAAADMEILEFARERWKYQGAQEAALRERFGMTLVAYFQRLNQLMSDPAAEAYDPDLVRRLRRLREMRRHSWTNRPAI